MSYHTVSSRETFIFTFTLLLCLTSNEYYVNLLPSFSHQVVLHTTLLACIYSIKNVASLTDIVHQCVIVSWKLQASYINDCVCTAMNSRVRCMWWLFGFAATSSPCLLRWSSFIVCWCIPSTLCHPSRPVAKDNVRWLWASAGTRGLGMIISYKQQHCTMYMFKKW